MDNSLILPNISIRPPYPEFAKSLRAPELEDTGPARYDALKDLTVKTCSTAPGFILATATRVMNTLIEEGLLQASLGIRDGIAIQENGIDTFRAIQGHLKIKEIHLWRSVASSGPDVPPDVLFGRPDHYLPVLKEQDGSVDIEWKPFTDCKWLRSVDVVFFAPQLLN